MKIHHTTEGVARTRPLVLAIGFFDGFHAGHRAIVKAALRMRRVGHVAGVLTFANHPAAFLRPGTEPPLLMTLEERINAIARAGIDEAFVLPFDASIARLSPQAFIDDVLIGKLQVRGVAVGENFRFGAQRAGDARYAAELLQARGVAFTAVPTQTLLGAPVSSTRIREALQSADVQTANVLLCDGYTLRGRVVFGEGRGHDLDVPTANLVVSPQKLLPKDGVYAAAARHDGREYAALVSIGTKPTFGEHERAIEVWLRDFARTVYGEEIALRDFRFLREQRAFASVESLLEQMHIDMEAVRFPTVA